MGKLQADEMAAMVKAGGTNLHDALGWHLQHNHYPPLPESLIGVAERAIDKANQGEKWRTLVLPKGCTVNGRRSMPAWQVIGWLHLESFLEGNEDGE